MPLVPNHAFRLAAALLVAFLWGVVLAKLTTTAATDDGRGNRTGQTLAETG